MTGDPSPGLGASGGVAALPMYDWPEIRDETDALWSAIRRELERRRIAAPQVLARAGDAEALWTDPSLLLSQTCGYPYATRLVDRVTLIATPDYALPGAEPGRYYSVLVARRGATEEASPDIAKRRFAYNMAHSQSGFAAPLRWLAAHDLVSEPAPLVTGAHRASIYAVASGKADWAAIDAVTWELARRHEPAARELAVFATTPQTPGLPLICGADYSAHADAIRDAVSAAIAGMDRAVREAILITGLVASTPRDYAALAAPLPVKSALPAFSETA